MLYFWCRWRTALHRSKRRWQVIGFVSSRRRDEDGAHMTRLTSSSAAVYHGRNDRVWRQHQAVSSCSRSRGHCWWRSVAGCLHVSHVSSVCFFHLCQLPLIRRSLIVDTAHVLVTALTYSRLDYCNSLFAGFHASQPARLQSVLAVLYSSCPQRTPKENCLESNLPPLSDNLLL